MNDFVSFLWLIFVITFPFVAMVIFWRRMKQVRSGAYKHKDAGTHTPAWEERLESENGLNLIRTSDPNEDLIDLGARANQPPWPLSNQ